MKNKSIVKILVPVFFLLIGCNYQIRQPENASKSLMFVNIGIPKGFGIKKGSIMGEDGEIIQTSYKTKPHNIRHGIFLFANLDAGNYEIRSIYAETVRTTSGNTTSWQSMYLELQDADKKLYMPVKEGEVVYLGNIRFINKNSREKEFSNIAAQLKVQVSDLSKGIITEAALIGGKKKANLGRVIVLRLDHPAIIGEQASLKLEELFLKQVFPAAGKGEKIQPGSWEEKVSRRLQEISEHLSRLK